MKLLKIKELNFRQEYTERERKWHSRPGRVNIWRNFVSENPGKIEGDILVCGLDELEKKIAPGARLIGTNGNYDTIYWEPVLWRADFKKVFCFEVLEHLMNPLLFLRRLWQFVDEDSDIYISFPSGRPQFLWDHHHFNEFDHSRAKEMFWIAGYKIVRTERTPILWNTPLSYLKGIRPFLRLFFPLRCRLYHLKGGWNE
jgi:hypothetical protein